MSVFLRMCHKILIYLRNCLVLQVKTCLIRHINLHHLGAARDFRAPLS